MPPPKKIKLPSGALPADVAASHRAYVMDRTKRIKTLLADVAKNERLETQFFANPNTVAKKFGVTFNREEIAGLKSLRGVDRWELIASRFLGRGGGVALFDNNCGCDGVGGASW